MEIDNFVSWLGIASAGLQLLIVWPYRSREYFKQGSYYRAMLHIRRESPIKGWILILLFYLSVTTVFILFIRTWIGA